MSATPHPDVLAALASLSDAPASCRHASVLRGLGEVLGTRSEIVPFAGPCHAAMEMALHSCLGPGDVLLVLVNGVFARRIVHLAAMHRIEVRTVTAPETQPYELVDLQSALERHPDVTAVAAVHHETAVGVANPIADVCRVARERGLLTIIDAVSSAGGAPVLLDEWGVDACVTAADRCLGAVAGVAPVVVGERAWARVLDEHRSVSGWYLDLATWHWASREWDRHPHPATMPGRALAALGVAVERLLEEGLDAAVARHAATAERAREGLRSLGLEPLVDDAFAAPTVTAVRAVDSMDVEHYRSWLRRRHGLTVAPALEIFEGRAFRVAHMGEAATPEVVDRLLDATEHYLDRGKRVE